MKLCMGSEGADNQIVMRSTYIPFASINFIHVLCIVSTNSIGDVKDHMIIYSDMIKPMFIFSVV
jgi:hypothetical protein